MMMRMMMIITVVSMMLARFAKFHKIMRRGDNRRGRRVKSSCFYLCSLGTLFVTTIQWSQSIVSILWLMRSFYRSNTFVVQPPFVVIGSLSKKPQGNEVPIVVGPDYLEGKKVKNGVKCLKILTRESSRARNFASLFAFALLFVPFPLIRSLVQG